MTTCELEMVLVGINFLYVFLHIMVKYKIISTLSIHGRRGFLTSSKQCIELIQ